MSRRDSRKEEQSDWRNFKLVSLNPDSGIGSSIAQIEVSSRGEAALIGGGRSGTAASNIWQTVCNSQLVVSPNQQDEKMMMTNNEGVLPEEATTRLEQQTESLQGNRQKSSNKLGEFNASPTTKSGEKAAAPKRHPLDAASLISKLFFG